MKKYCIWISFVLLSFSVFSEKSVKLQTTVDVNVSTSGLYNVTLDRANWITLLNVAFIQKLWKGGSLDGDLLAVYNNRDSRGLGSITPGLHIYSAIEDATVPLSLFMFGLTQQLGPLSLFFGTRNVNNDYFISPWNSIFTGSTNGLLPVISNEYPLSDSPLSALCLHIDWEILKNFRIKNSLYNGMAGQDWLDRFRFNPRKDGVLNITELSYKSDNLHTYTGNYHVGYVVGNVHDEHGVKQLHQSFWTLLEQPFYIHDVNHQLECVVQGGYSPRCQCDLYFGFGLVWFGLFTHSDYLGTICNRTWHSYGDETTLELTYMIPLGKVMIQPAYFHVFSSNRNQSIFLVKLGFEFNYAN